MSEINNFDVDVEKVLNLFKDLSYKRLIGTYKKALRKSANIIAKQTRANLKKAIGKGAIHKGRYGPMNKGIKVSVQKNGKLAKVHIMGDYRLKWFETGTAERYLKKTTKKGKQISTGKIHAYYFFKDAIALKKRESEESLLTHLSEAIIKINNKHK